MFQWQDNRHRVWVEELTSCHLVRQAVAVTVAHAQELNSRIIGIGFRVTITLKSNLTTSANCFPPQIA